MQKWEYLTLRYGRSEAENGKALEEVKTFLYAADGLKAENHHDGEIEARPNIDNHEVADFINESLDWTASSRPGWAIYHEMIGRLGIEGWEMVDQESTDTEMEEGAVGYVKFELKDIRFKRPIED